MLIYRLVRILIWNPIIYSNWDLFFIILFTIFATLILIPYMILELIFIDSWVFPILIFKDKVDAKQLFKYYLIEGDDFK